MRKLLGVHWCSTRSFRSQHIDLKPFKGSVFSHPLHAHRCARTFSREHVFGRKSHFNIRSVGQATVQIDNALREKCRCTHGCAHEPNRSHQSKTSLVERLLLHHGICAWEWHPSLPQQWSGHGYIRLSGFLLQYTYTICMLALWWFLPAFFYLTTYFVIQDTDVVGIGLLAH